jgi:hypothetical protein
MALVNPRSIIEGSPLLVKSLLSQNSYQIPDYQRQFVWEKSQLTQLIQDLITHYHQNTDGELIKNSPNAYYLGGMAMIKGGNDDHHEVVDGQQRLTSLCCIASALWALLNECKSDPRIEGIKNALTNVMATHTAKGWLPKVEFQAEKLNNFFVASLVEHRTPEEKKMYWDENKVAKDLLKQKKSAASRIRSAIETAHAEIEQFLRKTNDAEERKNRLISFCEILQECTVVLRITATSPSSAYSLFESLNFRGMSLTQADLVKNQLIKLAAGPDQKVEIVNYWSEITSSLEGHGLISLPDFLHYSFISRHKHIPANKLFEALKEQAEARGAAIVAEELSKDADLLEKLVHKHEHKWTPQTKSMLADVHQVLNVKLAYPLLLSGGSELSESPKEFEKFVRLTMNFCFRYLKIGEGDVGALAQIVSGCAVKFRRAAKLEDLAHTLLEHSPDEKFIEDFSSASVANTKLAYFVVYYLEKHLLSGTKAVEHGVQQNLEHIMPKTPKANDWPQAAKLKKSDGDKFHKELWRIGNLLALPAEVNKSLKNSSIQNKISNAQKKDYTHSDLKLPKEVKSFLDNDKWSLVSINDRQKHLAEKYCVKAWSLAV